jgi:hypothetical protein
MAPFDFASVYAKASPNRQDRLADQYDPSSYIWRKLRSDGAIIHGRRFCASG